MSRLVIVALLSAFACAACGSAGGTLVRDDGVHNALYPYRIGYADAERRHFVSEEWVVENYETDATGRPTALKTGAHYRASVLVDVTGDGQPDNLGQVPRYDLRLEHRLTGAHLFARAMPVEREHANLPLEDLARALTPRLANALAAEPRRPAGKAAAPEQAPPVRIASAQGRTFAGLEALDLVVEDLAPGDEGQVTLKTRYLVVRAPFRHPVSQVGRDAALLPVVILLGYSAKPDEYALGAPDFEPFVQHFALLDDAGVLRRETARLMRCDVQRDAATLKVEIDAQGRGTLLETDVRPEKKRCQAALVNELRFAATGERRTFSTTVSRQP